MTVLVNFTNLLYQSNILGKQIFISVLSFDFFYCFYIYSMEFLITQRQFYIKKLEYISILEKTQYLNERMTLLLEWKPEVVTMMYQWYLYTESNFFFLVTLKDGRKVMTNLDSILKSRDITLSGQGYGFSSGHVWI